jgi:hypothetical protein
MDMQSFAHSISFTLLQPEEAGVAPGRFTLRRNGAAAPLLLELPGAPFDAVNTALGDGSAGRAAQRALRPLLEIPRMSTLAIASVINRAVAEMPEGQAFVNVGVWHGFSLLAAMAGNPRARCVGIDNFSEWGGPRDAFRDRFDRMRSDRHEFFEMDYKDYFARVHHGPIGVYLYDGEHSYENQVHGLEAAEPFFAEGCVVLVDDTNWEEPRQATLDFVAQRPGQYEVLADFRTHDTRHPTFWNGLLVVRKRAPSGRGADPPRLTGAERAPEPAPAPSSPPRVSLIIPWADGSEGLARTVESALAQSWTQLEVIVADAGKEALSGLDERVRVVHRGGDRGAALASALEHCTASLVSVADARLDPDAVELSLAYPDATRFWMGSSEAPITRRMRDGIAMGRDVDALLSPGEPFVLVSDVQGLPATARSGPRLTLNEPPQRLADLDDEAAVRALQDLKAKGARHVVVLGPRFGWVARWPRFNSMLERDSTSLLANERVRVFRLPPD